MRQKVCYVVSDVRALCIDFDFVFVEFSGSKYIRTHTHTHTHSVSHLYSNNDVFYLVISLHSYSSSSFFSVIGK